MATLLKIDHKIINLDLVFEIEDYGDRLAIFYAVTSSDTAGAQQPAYSEVEGAAAVALRSWLAEQVIDLHVAPEGDAETFGRDEGNTERLARVRGAQPPAPQAGDNPYYGAARIAQMQGTGDATDA